MLRAEKLVKKARKAKLIAGASVVKPAQSKRQLAETLFALTEAAQERGWSAEELLRGESARQERRWRQAERRARQP